MCNCVVEIGLFLYVPFVTIITKLERDGTPKGSMGLSEISSVICI